MPRKNESQQNAASSHQDGTDRSRRQILRSLSVASVAALAGCGQIDDDDDDDVEPRDPEWCIDENDVEVHEVLRTAESIDGIPRDPDDLSGRREAAYQCHPQGYQLCANCRFYIPGRPGRSEGVAGACSIVEGLIRSQDWCALYQETERLAEFPSPDPSREPGPTRPPRLR